MTYSVTYFQFQSPLVVCFYTVVELRRLPIIDSKRSSTSCARGDTICPARCRPGAAAQLQPIPYTCCAQRALFPIAVGAMNINELMNINDVRESATIFPRPCKLTFDLLTLKVVSESRVTWTTCMPILVFLSLSVLELFPMYATDVRHQTNVRRQTKGSLNAPLPGGGNIINNFYTYS